MNSIDQQWPGEPPAQLVNTSTRDILNLQEQAFSTSRQSSASLPRGHDSQTEDHDSGVAGSSRTAATTGASKRTGTGKRNALSCAKCRRLKLKCSRVWPCTSCVRRKCAHICPDEMLKDIRPRNKEINDLKDRIRELESRLAKYGDELRGNVDGEGQRSHDVTPEEQPAQFEGFNLPSSQAAHPGASDVVEVMGTLMISTDGSSRYLGKSAANALLHETHSDDGGGSVGSDTDDDDANSSVSGLGRPSGSSAFPWLSRSANVQDFQPFLPPFNDAQALGRAYFFNCSYVRLWPARSSVLTDSHADVRANTPRCLRETSQCRIRHILQTDSTPHPRTARRCLHGPFSWGILRHLQPAEGPSHIALSQPGSELLVRSQVPQHSVSGEYSMLTSDEHMAPVCT